MICKQRSKRGSWQKVWKQSFVLQKALRAVPVPFWSEAKLKSLHELQWDLRLKLQCPYFSVFFCKILQELYSQNWKTRKITACAQTEAYALVTWLLVTMSRTSRCLRSSCVKVATNTQNLAQCKPKCLAQTLLILLGVLAQMTGEADSSKAAKSVAQGHHYQVIWRIFCQKLFGSQWVSVYFQSFLKQFSSTYYQDLNFYLSVLKLNLT